jgi:cysteine desulfurase
MLFTSGATEANNLAIVGVANAALLAGDSRREVIVSAIEHKSVLASAQSLVRRGFKVTVAPVCPDGTIDTMALRDLVSDETLIVSTMAVNNEVGTVQPLDDIVEIVRRTAALLHVDAAQAIGKISIDVSHFDFASLSSHKVYGPMGIGALFVSAAALFRPEPILFGGAQEHGIRPGTLPTPLVVGFGAAAKLASFRLQQDSVHSALLADRLLDELSKRQVQYTSTVPRRLQVPGSISLRIFGAEAISVIGRLGNSLSISEGSACTSGDISPSHVLTAMGIDRRNAYETLRIYCGRYNTIEEMELAADAIARSAKI